MTRPGSSDTTTDGLRVEAVAQYLPAESDADERRFVFRYRIRLSNVGERRAKLRSRHWVILDADNRREDVRGPGVVGQHPDLGPGQQFEYTSSCQLRTHWGTMEGTYTFEREDSQPFDVRIGRFFLAPAKKLEAVR